jgi:hypothetical protein
LFDAVLMRAAQDGALISGNLGRGCGAVVLPSPDPEVGAGAVTAGGVGATEAVISNPVDERKIAANKKIPWSCLAVISARADERVGVRAAPLVIYVPARLGSCQQSRVLIAYLCTLPFN